MTIPTSQIVWMLSTTTFILFMCYILIRIVVKEELKKSLPNQLKAVRELFGQDNIELNVKIDKNGKVTIDGFQATDKIEYAQ